ncbi:hypothetical protein [Sediminibacterium ginsengisoli]|uniref:Uncharacterized protein n=1 Tax=Sediminibacterium ginsengisoli TaxID=413434 RepID=A0A1T4QW08_9BACT|nr:hypothetical protein [Sediminibacterium ginsengisoli]SKA07826.1 hypothetical protein SAMN04488132_109139 [Sediminibacterium ginsengisoli]
MKKTLLLAGLIGILVTACKKEVSNDIGLYPNNPLNDTTWQRSIPANAAVWDFPGILLPDLVINEFDCSTGDTLHFGDSLEIAFTPGSCYDGSNKASGKVRLELFRLKSKGDFIKAFKPTVSNGHLLETSGAFFIRVSQDGREISLAPNASFTIRYSDIDDPKQGMKVFYAKETLPLQTRRIDTLHDWIPDTDTSWIKTYQRSSGGTNGTVFKGYELVSKHLRWVAACRYLDSTLPATKITAVLPPNFTNKNTVVFAVFANSRTVVQLPQDYASRSFAVTGIPLKSKITILSLTRIGADFYLGIKEINDVGTVVRYIVTPEKKTLPQILTYLNGL